MGKDCGSWLHHQFLPWKSSSINCKNAGPDLRHPNVLPTFTNPSCMISANGSLLGLKITDLPHLRPGQASGHGSFYHHNEAVTSIRNTVPNEKLSTPCECCQEATSNATPESVQKRFLVFDQSCSGKNLVFSSVIGSPFQHLNLANSTWSGNYGSHQGELATKEGLASQAFPVIAGGLEESRDKESQESREESEMHEDTEELDALLYSDGDSDYEDEETSTGHSPSEFTGHKKQEVEWAAEKIASSMGGMKRKRLPDEELMDTASSSKHSKVSDNEDEAESNCFNGRTQQKFGSSFTNKRLKREKIQETVSILQSMIPGGKGKDAVFILDQAIHYLKSLKFKANSLGLDLN